MNSRFFCVICVLSFFTATISLDKANAACSCSPDYPPLDDTAYEYTSNSCEPDQYGRFDYDSNIIRCSSGSVVKKQEFWDSGLMTPEQIASKFQGQTILRNESGTHVFVIVPHYPPLSQLLGITVPSSPGVYTFSELNKYCTHTPLSDNDGDGFPDCLDCAESDPNMSINCPACVDEQVAQCGSTDNALNWRDDPVEGCVGACKDKNLGNCP